MAIQKSTKSKGGAVNDVYTALMGLSVLALAGTIAVVCIYAQQMWGEIFRITTTS